MNVKTAELQQSQERLRALTSELNLAEQRERKRLATDCMIICSRCWSSVS